MFDYKIGSKGEWFDFLISLLLTNIVIAVILILILSVHFDETLMSGGATMWFPMGGHLQWINDDGDDDYGGD